MNKLNENIKNMRKTKGLTLMEMADKLGVTEATFQRYESGLIKNIKYEHIIKIAEIYGITPQELMGWKDTRQEEIDLLNKNEKNELKKVLESAELLYNNEEIPYEDKEEVHKALIEMFFHALAKQKEKNNK